jgi:hypothetical protein
MKSNEQTITKLLYFLGFAEIEEKNVEKIILSILKDYVR